MTLGSLWNLAQFLHTRYKRGLTMWKNDVNVQVMHLLLTSILYQSKCCNKNVTMNAFCIVTNWPEIADNYNEGLI